MKSLPQERTISVVGTSYLVPCGLGGLDLKNEKGLSLLPLWEVSDLLYNVIERREGTWELILCLHGRNPIENWFPYWDMY